MNDVLMPVLKTTLVNFMTGNLLDMGLRLNPHDDQRLAERHGRELDQTGTTRIGAAVINHSFLLPSIILSFVGAGWGVLIANLG